LVKSPRSISINRFFFSSRRRHTRSKRDWSSDVCSSDLNEISTSMTNIKRNLNETVKKAEQETRDLVSNAKHGALVTNIIDALKYGAATSAITIPVLYFLLS